MLVKLANSMFNMTSRVKAASPGVNLDNRYITDHPESLEMWKVVPIVCCCFFSSELLDPLLKFKGTSPETVSESQRKTYWAYFLKMLTYNFKMCLSWQFSASTKFATRFNLLYRSVLGAFPFHSTPSHPPVSLWFLITCFLLFPVYLGYISFLLPCRKLLES